MLGRVVDMMLLFWGQIVGLERKRKARTNQDKRGEQVDRRSRQSRDEVERKIASTWREQFH